VPGAYDRDAAGRRGDNAPFAMKSVVADPAAYDWEDDAPIRRPFVETYGMHVRGFTRHPSSGVAAAKRGTYAGAIQKIPSLKDLGITAVELLPVFQFDPHDAPPGRVNYWGCHGGEPARRVPLSRDGERVLGAADLRTTAGAGGQSRLAPRRGHRARLAGRHRSLGRRAGRCDHRYFVQPRSIAVLAVGLQTTTERQPCQ
jgi:hypothetical protein